MADLWYKNAIVYSLDVETFMDSDGDGVGDFPGLTQRLNYLAGLGVTCLWLLPFYPSPNQDNGYDVMDYYNIDPRLGTLGHFVEFMHEAEERGIRVLVDLVVNHTSDQHPWFQASRSDPNSQYRDYYVWLKEKPEHVQVSPAFAGVQQSVWTYDEQAQAYYLHRFYRHQPDLNVANPAVREEICRIMGFWLELGVSGFRIDAAPFLIEPVGMEGATLESLQNILPEMREFVSNHQSDAILLAEANVPPDKVSLYFGEGKKMNMLFSFLLNQYMFLALAREQADTLVKGVEVLPEIPHVGQWLNFVRHHDELTLDRLNQSEQQEVFQAFAPQENMQIYGDGIRRRLAPMLCGDRRHMELVYSLLLTLPGTPMIRYGDEIGMGDDLSLEERNSVRTPMQWSKEKNGGFSSAPLDQLARPVISDGEYGYEQVNVISQQRDPGSFLNWMERAIRTRKQCLEFGWGNWQTLETDVSSVFAHSCKSKGNTVIAIHNLSDQPCTVTLKSYSGDLKQWSEVFGDRQYEPFNASLPCFDLEAYGYRWFQISNTVSG